MFTLGDDQKVTLQVMGVDDAGAQVPAALDAPMTVASSDPTIATVALDPADVNGATAIVTAVGALGTVNITFTGTGNHGAAVLNDVFAITVVSTAAVGFAVVAGTPAHK